MSERPFMQLYVSDFVGDTLLLSTEHIGAYLLLLIALWNADGSLPSDDVKLARVVRCTVKKWHKLSVDLLPFFEVSNGVLSHHRLTKELQKAEAQSNSRALAGSKGGSANALKYQRPTQAIATAGLKHARASLEPYRKDGATLSDPTESLERVDKHLEPDLWAALLAMPDQPKPRDWQEHFSWPRALVAEQRGIVARAAA